jgi:hypothetical protein
VVAACRVRVAACSLALRQRSKFEKKLFRRQKIWRRKLGLSATKSRDFAAKLCHLTSDFSGVIGEAIAPEKNFQDFPKKVLMRFRVSR